MELELYLKVSKSNEPFYYHPATHPSFHSLTHPSIRTIKVCDLSRKADLCMCFSQFSLPIKYKLERPSSGPHWECFRTSFRVIQVFHLLKKADLRVFETPTSVRQSQINWKDRQVDPIGSTMECSRTSLQGIFSMK